jgi:hypothetical protein
VSGRDCGPAALECRPARLSAVSGAPNSVLWGGESWQRMWVGKGRRVQSSPCSNAGRYTYNYGYIGTRTTGTEAGDYMVVGPG